MPKNMPRVVSEKETKFYNILKQNSSLWLSSEQLSRHAGIAKITARTYCIRYVKEGILNRRRVFPGYRYQLFPKASKHPHVLAVEQALEVYA
jgi:response regulator of citrate/malate metabolism